MANGLVLLNRYEILGELGRGGNSDVVRAFDQRMEREVAIKRIPNNPRTAPRALREARTLALLNHTGIVTVHDFVEKEDYFYMVMEVVEGQDLAELLDSEPLPLQIALGIAAQIANALEFAHSNEIVHRDIKPSNLIIMPTGRVKVVDFGIARLMQGAGATNDESLVGTIGYLAPEQAEHSVIDDRTDLFLFATLLYRLLTGVDPFGSETAAGSIYKVINIDPPHPSDLNPDIPRQLGGFIMTALSKDAEDRYGSVVEFRYKLERFMEFEEPEVAAAELFELRTSSDAADQSFVSRIKGRGLGQADSPASAALAFVIVLAFLIKLTGEVPISFLGGLAAGVVTYYRPQIGIVLILTVMLIAAGLSQWWLALVGLPLAAGYYYVWRNHEAFAPLLPFSAPLLANLAGGGLGLGLMFPFISGFLLAPLPAALAALVGGFVLEGYDLLYSPELRYLFVPSPELAAGMAGAAAGISLDATAGRGAQVFLIQLTSPFATNPFLLLQPFLFAVAAFFVSYLRNHRFRTQAVGGAAVMLFMLVTLSLLLLFSPDTENAYLVLVRQFVTALPILLIIILLRQAVLRSRKRRAEGRED